MSALFIGLSAAGHGGIQGFNRRVGVNNADHSISAATPITTSRKNGCTTATASFVNTRSSNGAATRTTIA